MMIVCTRDGGRLQHITECMHGSTVVSWSGLFGMSAPRRRLDEEQLITIVWCDSDV